MPGSTLSRAASLALPLLALCLAADAARAQDGPRLRRGAFDVSVAAGAAHTTDWYEADARDGSPGTGPALALGVRYWILPQVGVRLGVGYFGGKLETPGQEHTVHNVHYEAALAWRPLAGSDVPDPLRSAYVTVGGGAVTTSVSDAGESECTAGQLPQNAVCIPESSTEAVLLAGAGLDLARFGRAALFAEVSVRRYASPARVIVSPLDGQPTLDSPPPPAPDLFFPAAAAADRTANTLSGVLGVRVDVGGAEAPAEGGGLPRSGTLRVLSRTAAEVYLVPALAAARDPAILCRLRPDGTSSYFLGYADANVEITRSREPQAYILVVRSGDRERRTRVEVGRGTTVTESVDLAQNSTPVCRQ
ncbi:MAG TPA: hypothetical protein VFX98_10085 [Longimicrobiaceae bacterium]|nr:hypothetical protein [Longimicrobiaceae bacterium]